MCRWLLAFCFLPALAKGEQWKHVEVEPEVKVAISLPDGLTTGTAPHIALYALPNGNTTEQTIGKIPGEGESWRFDIQHIGAQARLLRAMMPELPLVVAYVEAHGLSWPGWRQRHPDNAAMIQELLDAIDAQVPGDKPTWTITGHSGGGSFLWGFLNGVERIPESVTRIATLDSNYSFSHAEGHGDKIVEWLKRDGAHNVLVVMAYDDRLIELDGKRVVSDTGGTWRATHRMLGRLMGDFDLQRADDPAGLARRWRGLGGRIDVILYTNPGNQILHTVMVGEYNGFVHAMTAGTRLEGEGVPLGPRSYSDFMEP